jgi:hypothetical protein
MQESKVLVRHLLYLTEMGVHGLGFAFVQLMEHEETLLNRLEFSHLLNFYQ